MANRVQPTRFSGYALCTLFYLHNSFNPIEFDSKDFFKVSRLKIIRLSTANRPLNIIRKDKFNYLTISNAKPKV